MKKRIVMLLMSLFVLMPAFLGNAWGIENRGKHGLKQECQLMSAKRFENAAPNTQEGVNRTVRKAIVR